MTRPYAEYLNDAFGIREANTWEPRTGFQIHRLYNADEQDPVVRRIVSTLVRGLYNRSGDLHLTEVAPVVHGLPNPEAAWLAVVEFVMSRPELAQRVTTVTDRTVATDGEGGFWVEVLDLPDAVYRLLRIAPARDGLSASGEWWLGELKREVGPASAGSSWGNQLRSPDRVVRPGQSDSDDRDLPSKDHRN